MRKIRVLDILCILPYKDAENVSLKDTTTRDLVKYDDLSEHECVKYDRKKVTKIELGATGVVIYYE